MALRWLGIALVFGLVGCGSDGGSGGSGGSGGVAGSGGSSGSSGAGGGGNAPTVVMIGSGAEHTCAILSDDTIRCWGANAKGQLGIGSTETIGDDEPASAAPAVALMAKPLWVGGGRFHTCALLEGGRVQCWGTGELGQLGYGNQTSIGDDESADAGGFVDVGGEVKQLSVGGTHNCALLTNGSVRCWGFSMRGELGYGDTLSVGDDEVPATAGDVSLGFEPTQIWAGYFRSCAWNAQQVACWGNNTLGQLGRGNVDDIGDDEPAGSGVVDLGFSPALLSGGLAQTCASDGTPSFKCWGGGSDGQLGNGARDNLGDDEPVSSLPASQLGARVAEFAGGQSHTCARTEGSTLRCWGSSSQGQLGRGDTLTYDSAEAVSDLDLGADVQGISCGLSFCCAVLAGTVNGVKCWGGGASGVLGSGSTENIGDDEAAASGALLSF